MLCNSDGCVNSARKGHKMCHKCNSRRFAEKNPLKSCYNTLKNNAKRRHKIFTITFDDFKEFCVETNYIKKKGVTGKSYHIDRKIEELGYVKGNLQILTNTQNIKKYVVWKQRGKNGDEFEVGNNIQEEYNPDDVPF